MTSDPLTRLALEAPTDAAARRILEGRQRDARHDPAASPRLLEHEQRERDRRRAQQQAAHRARRRRRETRAIALFALAAFIAGLLILADQARAAGCQARTRPVPANVFRAVRAEWKTPADRREALDVIAGETGNTYDVNAANGQYLGIFQMGAWARHHYGHGTTARAQAHYAHRYWLDVGWSTAAWTCA